MRLGTMEKQELLPSALGQKKAQLVLKHAMVLDVFTRRFYPADVAIQDGWIVGVGQDYHGETERELRGKFIVPGLIDAHVHIESSMVSPCIFEQKVLPWGTTALIADPHEIVNVSGREGIRYFLEEAEKMVSSLYIMLPSCVPLSDFDRNEEYGIAEMEKDIENPAVLGLGEVMDYGAVLAGNSKILQKAELFADRMIDGHFPMGKGKELQAYRLAGVGSDHECSSYEEAKERICAGMFVQVREGSAAHNLDAILEGALREKIPLDRFGFCTDDKHLSDIARDGHIIHNVKKAILLGVSPEDAFTMGSFATAREYGLSHLGAAAPGRRADLLVLDELQSCTIADVYKNGVPLADISFPSTVTPTGKLRHTVNIPPLKEDAFLLSVGKVHPVIQLCKEQLATKRVDREVPAENGCFVPKDGLLKAAVIQRHDGSARTGLGVLEGFGLRNGAIAGTIGHDSHNLVVVGDNDADMLCAVEELKRVQGGYTLVSGGKVVQTLCLPVAGLFTDSDHDISREITSFAEAAREMGVSEGIDPFQNLSFLSLPVIPEIRLTDNGLYDVLEKRFL